MNYISSLLDGKVLNILLHFYKRLKETPLLLGYIIVGLAVTFGIRGFQGFAVALKNLLLLLIWALIIRIMTEDSPAPVKVKNPKLELCVGFTFFVYNLIIAVLVHNYVKNASFASKVHSFGEFMRDIFLFYNLNYKTATVISGNLMNAIIVTILITIPMILIYVLMGYKFRGMGFNRGHWKLTFVLIALSVLLGIYEGLYKKADYKLLIVVYFIHIFINGLPEELFFRGFLLPRLEAVLNNSLNALVISSILFSAGHIPSRVIQYNSSIWYALLDVFSLEQPTGLIWGYLYLRTRSIIPGMLWHASFTILGLIFLGL